MDEDFSCRFMAGTSRLVANLVYVGFRYNFYPLWSKKKKSGKKNMTKNGLICEVRCIKAADIEDVNSMRRMKGVRENITGLNSERFEHAQDWYHHLSSNDHVLVAEVEIEGKKQVIGSVQLQVKGQARLRHIGGIGIMVHSDFQVKGVGRKLMEEVLDIADNWLGLVRVELDVLVYNESAIHLYKSLGFVVEGVVKYGHFYQGQYSDLLAMGRYRLK